MAKYDIKRLNSNIKPRKTGKLQIIIIITVSGGRKHQKQDQNIHLKSNFVVKHKSRLHQKPPADVRALTVAPSHHNLPV